MAAGFQESASILEPTFPIWPSLIGRMRTPESRARINALQCRAWPWARARTNSRRCGLPASDLPASPGHPFYTRLNAILDAEAFNRFVEEQCRRFYAPTMGRPSLEPGRYFRLLLIGYFEGTAWRLESMRRAAVIVPLAMAMAAPVQAPSLEPARAPKLPHRNVVHVLGPSGRPLTCAAFEIGIWPGTAALARRRSDPVRLFRGVDRDERLAEAAVRFVAPGVNEREFSELGP